MELPRKMSRLSVLITEDFLKDVVIQEADNRIETLKEMEQIQSWASTILGILINEKDFIQTFLCTGSEDLHVYSRCSKRVLVIDALTRCSIDQVANFDTYKFVAHPLYEKKISTYTRTSEKPNPHLSKHRPWDVALSVIIKVEALEQTTDNVASSRLLFREYSILKHIWDAYLKENLELDEMTGIPMVFEFRQVPNSVYKYDVSQEEAQKILDPYGSLLPWKSESRSTMAYLSMERLGPNVHYLLGLMVHSKRKTRTFDFETAFKIFDQLICRCYQIHRFGVVHNAIEPENIFFGRSTAFDVVYLANYSKAMIIDSASYKKMAEVNLGGNPRYTTQYRVRGAHPNPMHDIESAFYTLLSMIVTNLPWDINRQRASQPPIDFIDNYSNQEGVDLHFKVRESKLGFWRSQAGINRVLADVRYLTVGDYAYHVSLAMELIKDIYTKLRDQFQLMANKPSLNTSSNPTAPQLIDYQLYAEIRRTTLLFFRFESLSVSLGTTTYLRKIEAISRDEQEPRPAWNLTNWCFNAVQMSAPGNTRMMRMSMVPASMISARPNTGNWLP